MSRFLILALIGMTFTLPSLAESTTRRGGGGDNSALLLQLQQAQAQAQAAITERDAIKAEQVKLKEELDAIRKETARFRSESASMRQRIDAGDDTVARFKEANSEAVARVRETQERLDKVVEKYKELVASLKEIEIEKAKLQDIVATQSAQLDVYAKHNLTLYEANVELLDQYRRKSAWDALKQREPVTGLGRVEVENMVEQYRARIDKARLPNPIDEETPATP